MTKAIFIFIPLLCKIKSLSLCQFLKNSLQSLPVCEIKKSGNQWCRLSDKIDLQLNINENNPGILDFQVIN